MTPKKVDGNQKRLVEQIRQIPGVTVAHTHMIGKGFPDLVLGVKGMNFLLEVKDPSQPKSKRKLTPDEQAWHDEWAGQVVVVETFDDVVQIINRKK
jgi:hypothetical protein